jgi:hypothetical protein
MSSLNLQEKIIFSFWKRAKALLVIALTAATQKPLDKSLSWATIIGWQ